MKVCIRILPLLLLLSLLLCSCTPSVKPTDKRVVAKVGDLEITYDEFVYFLANSKKELDGGDDSAWADNADLKKQLEENLLYRLKRLAAIAQMAKEYDISLSNEDKKVISEHIEQIKGTFEKEEDYLAMLEGESATEYALSQVLRNQYLFELVAEHIMDEKNFLIRLDDAALYADLEENFWRGGQILIRNDKDDVPAKNKELAEQILAKLKSGEKSFLRLVGEYGEDPGMQGNENGYYFTTGQLLPYFEDAVKGLEIGEYTDVIECVHGYAIVIRWEMEEDYIKSHLEELRESMGQRICTEMVDEVIAKVSFEPTTLYHQLMAEMIAE